MPVKLTLVCHARMLLRPGNFAQDEAVDPAHLPDAAPFAQALGRIDHLWTGPEMRTRQTAGVLEGEAVIVPALRDCDFGSWRGRGLDEIAAADPEGTSAWLADMSSAPHGGEPMLDVLRRVGALLDAHVEAGHTVAVTHPAIIRAAIVHSLGAPPEAFWRIDVEPLSVTDLRLNAGRWTLRSMGQAPGS